VPRLQFAKRPIVAFSNIFRASGEGVRFFSIAVPRLRPPIYPRYLGCPEYYLCALSEVLRTRTQLVVALLLSASGILEIQDGDRRPPSAVRSLPQKFREFSSVQDPLPAAETSQRRFIDR
jgi:hypothetical protein